MPALDPVVGEAARTRSAPPAVRPGRTKAIRTGQPPAPQAHRQGGDADPRTRDEEWATFHADRD